MSTSSVLQDTSKNISLFRVRNTRSKEKCLRFFGEPEGAKLAIHTGGSSTKLLRMLSSAAQAQNPLSSRHHHHHHIYPTAMSTSSSSSSLSSTLSPANNNNNLLSSALSNLSMTVEIPQQALNNNNNHNLHHSSSSLSLASSTGGGTPVVASSRAAAAATISSRAVVHPIPLFNSSTRKIEQIFGQSCPVDVPVKDIGKTSGVSLLLQSKLPLAYFLGFLLTLKRPELVFFVVDIQKFEETVFDTNQARMDAAKSIFHTYIEKNSALLIKLTHKTSISCTSNIRSSGTLHPFSSAVSEVFCMLEQDFQTFKRSSEWKMMEEKLGKSAAVRNQVTTKETCNWLLKLFEKNYTTPNLLFTNILMANEVPTPPLPLEMEETGDDASSIASSSAISSIAPSAEPVSIDEGGNGGFPPVSISRPGFDVYRSAVKDNLRIFLANLKR